MHLSLGLSLHLSLHLSLALCTPLLDLALIDGRQVSMVAALGPFLQMHLHAGLWGSGGSDTGAMEAVAYRLHHWSVTLSIIFMLIFHLLYK